MKRKRTFGFTLIELLTVIAIIGVLAGIIIGVIGSVRNSAKSALCMTNLRQIALAGTMYSSEHKGRQLDGVGYGANDTRWRAKLLPYLGEAKNMEMFLCPSDEIGRQSLSDPTKLAYILTTGCQPSSYGLATMWYYPTSPAFNLPNPGPNDARFMRSNIASPVSTIFVADMGIPASYTLSPSQWTESSTRTLNSQGHEARMPSIYSSGEWTAYPRHGGSKANCAFFDGHAEAVDIEDLKTNTPGNTKCLYWPFR